MYKFSIFIMIRLINIVIVIALFSAFALLNVYADGTVKDNNGNVDIPGQQDSVDVRELENNKTEEEQIDELEGQIQNGLLNITLNYDEPAKFGIQTNEICQYLDNIVVETNSPFTGIIKVSGKLQNDTSEVDKLVGVCRFKLEGFDNSFVEKVKWTLTLNRQELEEREISKDSISMYISDQGSWDKVKTTKSDESNSEIIIYESETEDFKDGEIVIAQSKGIFSDILTVDNIAYFIVSVVGLLVLVAIGYLLLKKEE